MMRRKRLLIPILIVLLLTLIGCKDESVNYIGDYEEKEVLVKVEGVNRKERRPTIMTKEAI